MLAVAKSTATGLSTTGNAVETQVLVSEVLLALCSAIDTLLAKDGSILKISSYKRFVYPRSLDVQAANGLQCVAC